MYLQRSASKDKTEEEDEAEEEVEMEQGSSGSGSECSSLELDSSASPPPPAARAPRAARADRSDRSDPSDSTCSSSHTGAHGPRADSSAKYLALPTYTKRNLPRLNHRCGKPQQLGGCFYGTEATSSNAHRGNQCMSHLTMMMTTS